MNHFYTNIQGWFDFQDIYRDQVQKAKDGDVFVEVGSYKGRSTSFMAVEIMNSGKKIDFYAVDIWQDNKLFYEFRKNIDPVKKYVHIIKDYSTNVYISADFVFIDADHDYENVKADVEHWKPQTKTIGGHDYSEAWPGVCKAVQESFESFKVIGNSWIS